VLAVRFFLILAVTWTLTGLSAKPQLAATFPPALFIAVIGVAIPLYLLQAGSSSQAGHADSIPAGRARVKPGNPLAVTARRGRRPWNAVEVRD
jgi:hypothetical protein